MAINYRETKNYREHSDREALARAFAITLDNIENAHRIGARRGEICRREHLYPLPLRYHVDYLIEEFSKLIPFVKYLYGEYSKYCKEHNIQEDNNIDLVEIGCNFDVAPEWKPDYDYIKEWGEQIEKRAYCLCYDENQRNPNMLTVLSAGHIFGGIHGLICQGARDCRRWKDIEKSIEILTNDKWKELLGIGERNGND